MALEFPSTHAGRFPSRRLLRSSDGGAVWLVEDRAANHFVLKHAPVTARPEPRVLDELARRGRSDDLALPIECTTDEKWCYQVIPYYPLGSLDAVLKRSGALSGEQCQELLRQLCRILSRLHTPRGGIHIVHGDIKPSNILIARNRHGRPRYILADFDAATLLENDVRCLS